MRNIMYDLEVALVTNLGQVSLSQASRIVNEHAEKLKNNDLNTLRKSVAKYPLYVNQYFMKRANEFMDGYARDVIGIKYYWGRFEFTQEGGKHTYIFSA